MFVSRWPSRDQPARGEADLVDDLGDLEVAPEPELAGRAERAADGAAGLARDAQRVPLARARPRRVVHQDRFDQGAVGEPVERLLGQAAVGLAQLRVGDRVEPEGGLELRAQGGRQRQRLVDRADDAAPHRVGDLARAVAGSPRAAEPVAERIRGQAGQARARRRRSRARRTSAIAADDPAPGRAGTRPRASAGRPPAGPRGARASRRAVARPRGPNRPAGSCSRRAGARRARRRADHARCRRTSRATAGRHGPGARARPRVAPGRAGRPRAGAAGSASRPPRAAARREARRAATVERSGQERRAAARRDAPRARGRSRPGRPAVRACATIGPVSSPSSIRIRLTPVVSSPARIVAGIGVAPRCRGRSDGWRLRAPCRSSRSAAGTIWP